MWVRSVIDVVVFLLIKLKVLLRQFWEVEFERVVEADSLLGDGHLSGLALEALDISQAVFEGRD